MEGERVLFLTVAFATHAVVGYALVRGFTDADPRIGLIFGLVPDGDFLFPTMLGGYPFVHRGITHTPLFALTVVICMYAVWRDRSIALAVGLALGSHLAIDSLSAKGIDWVFPLAETGGPGLSVHGPVATIVLWTVSIGILVVRTDVLERSAERSDPELGY